MKKLMMLFVVLLLFTSSSFASKDEIVGIWQHSGDPSLSIVVKKDNTLIINDWNGMYGRGKILANDRFVINFDSGDSYYDYRVIDGKLTIDDYKFREGFFRKITDKNALKIENHYGIWKNKDYVVELSKDGFAMYRDSRLDLAWKRPRYRWNEFNIPVGSAPSGPTWIDNALENIIFHGGHSTKFKKEYPGVISTLHGNDKYSIINFYNDDSKQLYFYGQNLERIKTPVLLKKEKILKVNLKYLDRREYFYNPEIDDKTIEDVVALAFGSKGLAFDAKELSNFPSWINDQVFGKYYSENSYLFSLVGDYYSSKNIDNLSLYRIIFEYDLGTNKVKIIECNDESEIWLKQEECYKSNYQVVGYDNSVYHYSHETIKSFFNSTLDQLSNRFGKNTKREATESYPYAIIRFLGGLDSPMFFFKKGIVEKVGNPSMIYFSSGEVRGYSIGNINYNEVYNSLEDTLFTHGKVNDHNYFIDFEEDNLLYSLGFSHDSMNEAPIIKYPSGRIKLKAVTVIASDKFKEEKGFLSTDGINAFMKKCGTVEGVQSIFDDGMSEVFGMLGSLYDSFEDSQYISFNYSNFGTSFICKLPEDEPSFIHRSKFSMIAFEKGEILGMKIAFDKIDTVEKVFLGSVKSSSDSNSITYDKDGLKIKFVFDRDTKVIREIMVCLDEYSALLNN